MYLSYVPDKLAHDEHLDYIDYENVKKKMYAITTHGRIMNIKSGKEIKQRDKQGYRVLLHSGLQMENLARYMFTGWWQTLLFQKNMTKMVWKKSLSTIKT